MGQLQLFWVLDVLSQKLILILSPKLFCGPFDVRNTSSNKEEKSRSFQKAFPYLDTVIHFKQINIYCDVGSICIRVYKRWSSTYIYIYIYIHIESFIAFNYTRLRRSAHKSGTTCCKCVIRGTSIIIFLHCFCPFIIWILNKLIQFLQYRFISLRCLRVSIN